MVIDLIMLILISSVFFLIVSSQMSHQSSDAAAIRTKSMQIQRTMIALLNARSDINSTLAPNATVAELISAKYCSTFNITDFNNTVMKMMQIINKPDNYFILLSCAEGNCTDSKSFGICSPEIESKFNCSIKIENINVARLSLNLPSNCTKDYTDVELGIWPSSMEVEAYVN